MTTEFLNIFYTDDDVEDQDLFRQAARNVSELIKVTTHTSGDDLLAQLNNKHPIPKVILLDLNIPLKNGYQILKELKSSPQFLSFPVVIFSTSDDNISISITRKLGASMYVIKPDSYNSLVGIIKYIIAIDWDTFVPSMENYVYFSDNTSSKISLSYIASAKIKALEFIKNIKTVTLPQHKLLESQLLFSLLMSEELNSKSYYYYLLMMKSVIGFCEGSILPVLSGYQAPASKDGNLQLIENDLQRLNFLNSSPFVITEFMFLAEEITLPVALGFLYVIEGAKLGGKVIYKNVFKTLKITATTGAGFISGSGETSENWTDFMSWLSNLVTTYDIEKEVIQAASLTFTSIYHFFLRNRQLYEN